MFTEVSTVIIKGTGEVIKCNLRGKELRFSQAEVFTVTVPFFCHPLPAIFLAKVCSLANKLDELQRRITSHRGSENSCGLILTEMWLNYNTADFAVELTGCTWFCAEGTSDTGKATGGGLHIYINNTKWCTNAAATDRLRIPDLEDIIMWCRSWHLPGEFTVVFS